jgi:hypothetical protein
MKLFGTLLAIVALSAGGTVNATPAEAQGSPAVTSGSFKLPGIIAMDPKWSSLGSYLYKMLNSIQKHWERSLGDAKEEPPPKGYVTVKLRMDLHGEVMEILEVNNKSSDTGKFACLRAITLAAPFGAWTPEMVASFGSLRDLTFRFIYE